ncbi:MAG: hypothetical protein RLZZ414_811 [Bacteroidota bacterium]|jgi:hypothetical protein
MGKLVLDWEESNSFDFDLIGISTNIPDYQLVAKINAILHIDLERKREDYSLNLIATETKKFRWYSYFPKDEDLEIFLIVNKGDNGYLVEEIKQMNSFLLIFGELNYLKSNEVAQQIQSIPQVISSTNLDIEKLKSKNNFVF